MTNLLVGDVYDRIIQEVITLSTSDFEESGISQGTLTALQQEWRVKLSGRGVAQMPWDPKPVQQSPAPPPAAPANNTKSASSSYPPYETPTPTPAASTPTNGVHIKTEVANEPQFNANQTANGYAQNAPQAIPQPQGGIQRAQQLVQAQYGQAASASLNAMQRGGLALPGQQPQQARPQGLHLPQQPQQQQQPSQPRIKSERGGPEMQPGAYQQAALPNYSQTDGTDDAMADWKAMLAEKRAVSDADRQRSDHMIRDHIMQLSEALQSGLMVPLDQHRSGKDRTRKLAVPSSSAAPAIPQLDGDVDEDVKAEEDDENAINSDLDDDSDGKGLAGDDDDDYSDEILCTYDKVQRVKNKWKCTLKDGIMSAEGKDWVFHKGMGEFEW